MSDILVLFTKLHMYIANEFCHKEIYSENRGNERACSINLRAKGLSHYVPRWHLAVNEQSLLKC